MNTAKLVDFHQSLVAQQQRALASMNASTGEAFQAHLDEFVKLTGAINVLLEYRVREREANNSTAAAAPAVTSAPAMPSISTDVEIELLVVRNIIGLAAFACEARRVLAAVDQVTAIHPSTGEVLSQMISVRSNWHEMGNYAADVLNDVRGRLDTLLGDTP